MRRSTTRRTSAVPSLSPRPPLGSPGLVFCAVLALLLTGGIERDAAKLNRSGTDAFEEGRYEEAARLYSDALTRAPESESISYNLGTALYKTERLADAAAAFARAARSDDGRLRLNAMYNLGNTQFKMGNLQKAVEAYKGALEVDPADFDTKVALEKALELLEQQDQEQQQEQQQQGDQDQEGQEGQDGSRGGDDQLQQQEDGSQQESEQGDQDQQGDQEGDPSASESQEPQQPEEQQPGAEEVAEGELRYEEALRILEAMRDQEKEQQKAKAQKMRARAKRGGKDW